MKILENYENAKQKYGLEIVKLLSDYGLPPKYLQSACRYHKEEGVPIDRLILLFKEWMKYVVKYNQVDVNTLSYDVFLQTLAKGKSEHLLPNVLYKDENCTLFSIDNIKDARNLPNHYCIKAVDKYNILKEKGYLFLLIYLPQQQFPFTYVVASIHDGNVEYWDSQNYKMYNNEADDFRQEQYESLLPNEVKTIIQNMTENKENLNCNRNMKRTNKIRLTESQLHRVIKESVKRVLREMNDGQKQAEIKQSWKDIDDEYSELNTVHPRHSSGYYKDFIKSRQENGLYATAGNSSQYNKTVEHNAGRARRPYSGSLGMSALSEPQMRKVRFDGEDWEVDDAAQWIGDDGNTYGGVQPSVARDAEYFTTDNRYNINNYLRDKNREDKDAIRREAAWMNRF